MVVGSCGAAAASWMPGACCSVSSMRSSRRATGLLRWVAWPTSARGARVPSSGSVVISSTTSMGSGLAWRWVAGLGRLRLAIWRP